MNTSTQPPEGAGGSRSRAAGELTLGLMSGEERGCTPISCCSFVGASLLAMDDNDNAGSLIHLGALRFFASRLACMFRLEGAGGSRSRAAGELTLGLMSGEERRGDVAAVFLLLLFCGSQPAGDGGLSVDSILIDGRIPQSRRPVGRLALAFDMYPIKMLIARHRAPPRRIKDIRQTPCIACNQAISPK
jgi:hypothetical protein